MDYEDIENDKLPDEVWSELFRLIQLEPIALIKEVASWDAFYGRWAILCRKRDQSDRIIRINDSTFTKLAEGYPAGGGEKAGTLLTTLWCMPDVLLDDIIRIHNAAMAA